MPGHKMTNTLAKAVALLQSGHIEDATRQLARLASTSPPNADVYRWLAIAHVRTRNFRKAQLAIKTAIEINPASADFLLTAANIEQDLGNPAAAIDLLQQANRAHPKFAEGRNNLGIILADLGRIDEAIPVFLEAIHLKPGYARAYVNLAAAQLRSLLFDDALSSARRAAVLQPDYAHAHLLCGGAQVLLGNTVDAEASLVTALRLKPDFVEASLLLARALKKMKRATEAEQVLQRACTFSPGHEEIWTMLGDISAERDDLPAALVSYERALQLRPNDISTATRTALLLPSVYENEAHVSACRTQFIKRIEQLNAGVSSLTHGLRPERFGDAISNSFLLAYQGRNDREIQRNYADFVGNVVERVLPMGEKVLVKTSPQNRRIRIGFCSRFFYIGTVGNYFASWITDLDRQVFEIYLYHTHVVEDNLTRRLRAASDHYSQAEESFAYFHKKIRADELDILIYPEIGMDRVVFLLAALRLATIQISGWGHPVSPGHRTIDYFISCAAMEPPGAQDHYNERLLTLPGIGTRYDLPSLPNDGATKTRSDYQLPENAHLYLCPQSLFKIHPANDPLLVGAMSMDPEGVLVMFAGQNGDITQKFVSRLQAAFLKMGVAAKGRVKILPAVSHDDYKQINRLCDVMLDSLYWSGGNTSLDALAMGLPIVTLPGEFMRGRQTMAMLKLLGADELIADSKEGYLKIALRLATDKPYRHGISQRIIANQAQLFDDPAPPRAFAKILEDLVRNPAFFETPQD